jgi:DHA2 family lincomycin resistance protein-like MFS transporter
VVSSGSAINSCIIQVANSIGQALFVGVMSADVVRMTGEGIAKAAAYSNAFSHTLIISLVIVAVCVVVGVVFTRVVIRAQKDNR